MRAFGSQMLVALGATWIIVRTALAGLACLSNPCIHGICMDDVNSTYSCYCIDGYTGIQCQTNWDECWSSPCKNGGICHDGIAAFNCSCPEGFVGEVCEINYDECESNPCQNNGTCIDADNGYACLCLVGYSGIHCELDIAVCNTTDSTRCANGGLCVEGPGISFSCVCSPGWTGNICEEPIDECASSPCHNGGICLDLHADYACACVFGFTGKNCEEEIIMCDDNPCENDALCLMEDKYPICYCVPDFHGDKCQFQYDECQLGPRCMNGGSCIDGVDNFTCSCPPDLTGILCECLIISEEELDCTYIRSTPYPSSEIPSSTRESREESTAISEYSSSTWTSSSTIYFSTKEYTSSSLSTGSVPSLSTETFVPNTTLEYGMTSTTFLPSSTYSTYPTYTYFTSVSSTSPPTETSKFSTSVIDTTTELTYSPSSSTSESTVSSSTEEYGRKTTTEYSTSEMSPSTELGINITAEPRETPTVFPTSVEASSTAESTTYPSDIYKTTGTSEATSVSMLSTKPPEATFTEGSSTSEMIPGSLSTFFFESTSIMTSFFTERPSTAETSTTPIFLEFTSTEFENITILPTPDCSKTFCLNGGTCVLTVDGHKCVCPFDAEGLLCEVKLGVRKAAFNGHSYLSHKLTKTAQLTIEIVAKTLSSSGILFYANMENTYLILYMQNGQLKFQFSCGFQTMLLSELKVPVNTGFDLFIKARLEFTKDWKYCNASLKVNNTLSMSGNQIAFVEHFTKTNSWLHLGGVPQEYVRDYTVIVPGYTGCMNNLKVNGERRNIFKDAQDGVNIKECSSLACLSDPCQNGATCTEHGESWSCHCRNGYIGNMCQQSVCVNNPCQFGATCVPYTGSGYLCLCPFGKHGHFCENDLEIMTPSFSSSVNGLSSFSAYPVPNTILHNMELSFKFTPYTMDQISLLLFIGQHGIHDSASDHLAVSFVRGYIMLTWNLGSGPRRIFTTKPIEHHDNNPHVIRLGRFGRRAWLKVDNFANITGRSPGKLVQLDVVPILYLGGHNSANFSTLPHDLPLHIGFSGCIFDMEIRAGALVLPVQSSRFAFGRSLGQCSMIECHERSCQNGGACLQHGPTFTCICQDGWFGPYCSLKRNPCDSTVHNCTEGSTCVPSVAGYECDCPIGKIGKFCEKEELLSDVSLSGRRSFIILSPVEFDSYKFIIEFELRPLSGRGIILFIGKIDSASFLSVSMKGSGLEVRVSLGQHKISNGHLLVIRSDRLLAIGIWQPIRIGVSGRKVMLSVDGTVNSGVFQAGEVLPLVGSSFYIGGMPDLSQLPTGAVGSLPVSFSGCIRQFHINNIHIPLTSENVSDARNVADCDGTPCGGDVCKNGGTCWLDPTLKSRCSCRERFSGERCEIQVPCTVHGCENQGRCDGKTCVCSVGWSGAYCEIEINVDSPRFFGNSYLMVEKMKSADKKRNVKMIKDASFIHLNISTASADGMILWSTKGEEFIGIGIENGYLKFAWSFPGSDTFVVEVPAVGHVSDGVWHEIEMSLNPFNITLWVDKTLVHRQTNQATKLEVLSMNERVFFLGGFPHNMSVVEETYGFFKTNFVGCIQSIDGEHNNTVDFASSNGENVGNCDVF